MRNIKLTISYDGTNYKGWQLQKNANTIQGEIEKAVEQVFGKHHRVIGASRTDSGVHAKGQVANFKISNRIPVNKIPMALNRVLPHDIVIKKAEEADKDFHSQFDAKRKKYCFYIYNSRQRDPFEEKYAYFVPFKLNIALMKREARVLVGKHDFKSFQASDKKERSSVRRIYSLTITKKKTRITISVEGDGFLYNMVRNIAGTLIDIGRGYLPEGSMKKILRTKDRKQAGPTASAKGLFLNEVKY